jgi:hypothetical protein
VAYFDRPGEPELWRQDFHLVSLSSCHLLG